MLSTKHLRHALLCSALSCVLTPAVKAETVKYTLINGDTVSGELIESESTDEIRILMSPVLGRLEIDMASIKVPEPEPLWKSSVSGGFSGNDTDGDGSFSGNLSASTRYKDADQIFKLAGGINYGRDNDKDKDPEITTKKGNLLITYDKFLSPGVTLYGSSNYNYDY